MELGHFHKNQIIIEEKANEIMPKQMRLKLNNIYIYIYIDRQIYTAIYHNSTFNYECGSKAQPFVKIRYIYIFLDFFNFIYFLLYRDSFYLK